MHIHSLFHFALLIGSVFFFLMLFKNEAHFFVSFCFLSRYSLIFNFFTNIAIYLCHSHYNFNILCVGYGKAIQTVMQAEWLACFWCISNHDQVPGLPGYDIILKYFPFQIILLIYWLYFLCFLLFYLRDRCDSSKISVLNKQ